MTDVANIIQGLSAEQREHLQSKADEAGMTLEKFVEERVEASKELSDEDLDDVAGGDNIIVQQQQQRAE